MFRTGHVQEIMTAASCLQLANAVYVPAWVSTSCRTPRMQWPFRTCALAIDLAVLHHVHLRVGNTVATKLAPRRQRNARKCMPNQHMAKRRKTIAVHNAPLQGASVSGHRASRSECSRSNSTAESLRKGGSCSVSRPSAADVAIAEGICQRHLHP